MESHYNIVEISDLVFEFDTDKNIRYNLTFLSFEGIFYQYENISTRIFTFNLNPVGHNSRIEYDKKTGFTVAKIIEIFFANTENAIIYICDDSDSRQNSRKRKFDYWFWKFNDQSILKYDSVAFIEGINIINTLLIHKNNPFLLEFIFAFNDLNSKVDEK